MEIREEKRKIRGITVYTESGISKNQVRGNMDNMHFDVLANSLC